MPTDERLLKPNTGFMKILEKTVCAGREVLYSARKRVYDDEALLFMPTIRDVARLSGVSIATVSHVLNNRSSKVGPQTRERVLAAVRELRYRPTAFEQKQKAVSTRNIAFIVEELADIGPLRDQYMGHVMDSVLQTAALNGFSVTFSVEKMWDARGNAVRRIFDGRCDGAIVVAPRKSSGLVATLWERGVPLVFVGSTPWLDSVSSVDIDNVEAGYQATRYLARQGHRRIAYIGAHAETMSSGERAEGYRLAMADFHGNEPVCALFTSVSSSSEYQRSTGGRAHETLERADFVAGWADSAVRQLLEKAMPDVSAVICWNDDLGRQVIRALRALGKSVPADISVVSFDDFHNAMLEPPHLTTFRQPLDQIGKTAVMLLLDSLTEPRKAPQNVRFSPDLIVRESTGSPRPQGTAASAAVS
jgi:DNA-binding LacI/PurR family transcriptional regulator